MKPFIIIISILLFSCKKESTTAIDPTPIVHNTYDYRLNSKSDTLIQSNVSINGVAAVNKNLGNRSNYTINKGDILTFEYIYKPKKSRLGPSFKPGQNLDSLINYYVNNPDLNSYCNFAIWSADSIPGQTIKFYYPKQKIIINGNDTTYEWYISGQFSY